MKSEPALLSLSLILSVALLLGDAIAGTLQQDETLGKQKPTPKKKSQPEGSRRPVLQIINGSRQPIEIYWLKSKRERVFNGRVEAGKDTAITTTIGHRFTIVGQKDNSEVTVTSVVPVQAFTIGQSDQPPTQEPRQWIMHKLSRKSPRRHSHSLQRTSRS